MPRQNDIEGAFRAAIKHEPSGRRTLATEDFMRHLALANWDWSLKEANEWIESHVSTFKDITTIEGQARTFMLYNPNGGL
ncbi:DNA polymerase V [Silvania hatchlandensis]|uniref:DNA polymerase V n=1 Tax=Silvania hatchlandensis TaxID=2926469 RepID=A0A9J6QAI8_9ENTR|nr:DNA polymerase V [Silvania hatchlandensis]MCU6666290.1 DNA polymerase V [Silvania hatchlandensis]